MMRLGVSINIGFGFSVAIFLLTNASLGYSYLINECGYSANSDVVKAILGLSVILVFASTVFIGLQGLAILGTRKIKESNLVSMLLSCVFMTTTVWGILAFPVMWICEALFGNVSPLFFRLTNSPLSLCILVTTALVGGCTVWIAKRGTSWIYFLGMLLCAYSFFVSYWIALSILYAI